MSVLASEEFEAGTIGAAVQEADVIFVNVDNTGITYVTGLNGTAKACNVAPATTGACRDSGFTPLSKAVMRFIFKFSALPAVDTVIAHMCLGDPNAGGLRVAHLYLTTTGKLVIRNGFTVVGTSTMTFATGTEYALEWMFDGANQQQSLRMFTSLALTAAAAESIGPVTANVAATVDWFQVGKMTNTTWTGGLTFDRYKRANNWVSSTVSTAAIWNEEWVGTSGNDVVLPSLWAKEGPNTASPKYATGGPNTDQSYLNFASQIIGNRNLLSLQMPSGLAAYERFYIQMNAKPLLPEENETVWAAGSLGGVNLFRLVASPGTNKTYNLELWADDDWNPTAPMPIEGEPPLPIPLGVINDLDVDFFHRIEISINATSGPALCTVKVWEGLSRNEPASPDQQVSGSCVGTTLIRYRRYGQMLHPSVAATVSHKGVAFDSIQLAQNGSDIGPLPDAQQFNPPLNKNWKFYEWTGADLRPLSLAGASLGGSALEVVEFTDQIINPPPTGSFLNDPGMGSKLYVGTTRKAASGKDEYDTAADLYNFEMRTLAAGSGHPSSDLITQGCFRGFYGHSGGINTHPSFGSHGDSNWTLPRKVAANTAISSWSYDAFTAGVAQGIYQGDHDVWMKDTLAPFIKDIYNRYRHLYCIDLGNEYDSGASTSTWTPLCLARIRRAARYMHFFLKDTCNVPEEAFMITCGTTITDSAQQHPNRHKIAINTTDTAWPGARGDAMYYYMPDWKETRTVADGYWTDSWDPNPVDFIQPTELDQWSYGRGPIQRMWQSNKYDKVYEWGNITTLNEFKARLFSIPGGWPEHGNQPKWSKAVWGGASPVLPVSSANHNGIPSFVGELGLPVWVPIPSSTNPAVPKDTADGWCDNIVLDIVKNCNIVAANSWYYVPDAYGGTDAAGTDTFALHWKVGAGGRAGTHLYDSTNSNTKSYASLFPAGLAALPPPWPDGTVRPPYVSIGVGGAKRDYRGFGDVP